MFSADLSWTDQQSETVGARRERKAKQRNDSFSDTSSQHRTGTSSTFRKKSTKSSPTTTATTPPKSSLGSGFGSFRKATSRAKGKAKEKPAPYVPPEKPITNKRSPKVTIKDPAEQPEWILHAKVSPDRKVEKPVEQVHASSSDSRTTWHETRGSVPYNRHSDGSRTNGLRSWAIETKAEADAVLKSYEQMKDQIFTLQNERETFLDNDSSVHTPRAVNRYAQPQYDPDEVLELPATEKAGLRPPQSPRLPVKSPLRTPVSMSNGKARSDYFRARTPTQEAPITHSEESSDEQDPLNSVDIMDQLPAILQTVTVECVEEKRSPKAGSTRGPRQQPPPPPPPPPGPPKPPKTPPPRPRRPDMETRTPQNSSRPRSMNKSQWTAPSNWEIRDEMPPLKETQTGSSPDLTPTEPIPNKRASNTRVERQRRPSPEDMTHFTRFVRRMEAAGPRIILERLKEEWEDATDDSAREEVLMEKHLWALTALHLKALDKFARASSFTIPTMPLPAVSAVGRKRRILELDGNFAEIYQASAMYPDSKITYLQQHAHDFTMPLPAQAEIHPLPGQYHKSDINPQTYPFVPLPYPDSSMHHVRSARLPALLPANHIKSLIEECYRVLKPGGILELRLIDPLPERGTTGPLLLSWLEDRLLIGLEAGFRCTRPMAMVPQWVASAGFVPLPFRNEGAAHGRLKSPPSSTLGSQLRNKNRQSLGRLGLARCLRLPAATEHNQDANSVVLSSSRSVVTTISAPLVSRPALRTANSVATLPANPSVDGQRDVIVEQLGCLVARALWKDTWGDYLVDPSDMSAAAMQNGGNHVVEDYWWWEDEEILAECREWRTVWSVGTLIVTKDDDDE